MPGDVAGSTGGAKRRRSGFAGGAICVFGIACLLTGAFLRIEDALFLRTAVRVDGHYTDDNGAVNSHGGYDYVYFIVFRPKTGGDVTFIASTHDHELPEKTPLPILYDPANPAATARLASEPPSPIGFELLSIGLPAAVLGGLLVRSDRRRLTNPAFPAPIG